MDKEQFTKDIEICAYVWDGGRGWLPEIPEALRAYRRLEQALGREFTERMVSGWINIRHDIAR